jgi:hypothetical protein
MKKLQFVIGCWLCYRKSIRNMTTVSSKNIQNQETKVKQVAKPNIHGLRNELRAKYPQSKFQSVYLSKNPLGSEFMVHYASKDIHLPFPAFCAHFDIDPSTINTDIVAITEKDNLLIINVLCRSIEKKSFFAQLKTFVYLCRHRNRKKKSFKMCCS